MAKGSAGSVRIGPVSIFTLVILLCMAVLAVLSFTTSQATYDIAAKQAAYTSDAYANEVKAQKLIADIDETLAAVRASGGSQADAMAAIANGLAADAKVDGNEITAKFSSESGRSLDIAIQVNPDVTYEIATWVAGTERKTTIDTGEKFWKGSR